MYRQANQGVYAGGCGREPVNRNFAVKIDIVTVDALVSVVPRLRIGAFIAGFALLVEEVCGNVLRDTFDNSQRQTSD